MYAVIRNGRAETKRALVLSTEDGGGPLFDGARFHVTPEGRLFVFYYAYGKGADGSNLSGNRLLEITPGGQSEPVKLEMKSPIKRFFTASWRVGCAASDILDVYGAAKNGGMSYARIRLK